MNVKSKRGRPAKQPVYTSFDEIPVAMGVNEAAAVLRTNPDWVYGAVGRKEIPALRVGPGGKIIINKYALFQAMGVRFDAMLIQVEPDVKGMMA